MADEYMRIRGGRWEEMGRGGRGWWEGMVGRDGGRVRIGTDIVPEETNMFAVVPVGERWYGIATASP